MAETLARSLPVVDLPAQLVHGDFQHNNVLFCDTELVAVLDFDFAGMRPRIDDLALPLGRLIERGMPLVQVRRLLDDYDSGSRTPLSDNERCALPFAMARMALSYLQYLTIPGDAAYRRAARRDLTEKRGPACEWWLGAIQRREIGEATFL